ncbi:MAG: YHS domain-containing protein [Desulfobulbaceae bacterium]|nr:YHS domain-containing protein [Desulfobulbaceae bacterium]
MFVIRLVALAVLFYVGWRLIRGIMGGSGKQTEVKGKTAEDSPVQDVLVEDPVCHTLVPKHQAIRLRRDGKTYYFCSDECCDKFSESARGEE